MLDKELNKFRDKTLSSKRKNFIDMTGNVVGRRTVKYRSENNKKGQAMWHCKCSCGGEGVVEGNILRSGQSQSCGCLHLEKITTHGFAKRTDNKKPRIYNIYQVMRKRCNNSNDDHYNDYGGRGIKCERDSFESFYKDMGSDYELHIEQYGAKNTSIDRINVNGNYNKINCRRATAKEQANNRRNTKLMLELRKLRNDNNDPLTRGRIEHCYRDNYPINKPVHKYITMRTLIYRWFESNRETAYNQSELERMQHEKRPELKELLLKFSNYL